MLVTKKRQVIHPIRTVFVLPKHQDDQREKVVKRSISMPAHLDEQLVQLGGKYSRHLALAVDLYLKGKNK